jgi:signal transduction histidine kinase
MSSDSLGLFDTPPNRLEIRIARAIVVLIFFTLAAALPSHNIYIGPVHGIIPTITAAMVVCDLITAAILYAQASVFRSRALTLLASGYAFCGLLLISWALTYPGAFSAQGLLGAKVNTTGWIAACWRLSVPAAMLLYAWRKRADQAVGAIAERAQPGVPLGIAVAIGLAITVTLMTTVGHDLLPSFFIDQSEVIRSRLIALNVVVILLTVAAIAALFRQERSVLDVWLLVALGGWLAQSVLNALLQSRFSLGSYVFFGLVIVSNLVVMLALLTESNRLYARIALSTAAKARERDARLISMDAVAAAIAHEVGQPLAAASLSSSAALRWLTRPDPDIGKAIASLHDVIDSGERTFNVIKDIRASFAEGAGSVREFALNDLVRETAHLMDRELAARKVSLQLDLDDNFPPVVANRVQIQRVLINLLTNAIESVSGTRRRERQIAIRSGSVDGRKVQVDIHDSGTGISSETINQIFEPFFTTKSTGTGLGLSLSRTIIDEHGGRLWASSNEDGGATFHLELPSGRGVAANA